MRFLHKIINLKPNSYRVIERRPFYIVLTGPLLIIAHEVAVFYKFHLIVIAILFRISLAVAAHPLVVPATTSELSLFFRFQMVVLGICLRVFAGTLAGEAALCLISAVVNAALTSTVPV